MRCNNILEAIGRTPLVRLNRINHGLKPQMYVKADYTNPGGSVKDRIGVTMIDDAEKRGLLKPGGTIIEGTSGNTGMGLALVAAVRGYKMVFTITDKQSKEKVDLLKALGAEVIVCPTAVEPDHPRRSLRLAVLRFREAWRDREGQDLRRRRHRRRFFPGHHEPENLRRRHPGQRRRMFRGRTPPGENGRLVYRRLRRRLHFGYAAARKKPRQGSFHRGL